MLKSKHVSEVIDTGDVALGETGKMTALIGKPKQLSHIDWYCPYQKIGIGYGKGK